MAGDQRFFSSSSLRACIATAVASSALFETSFASATAVGSCLDDGGATTLRSVIANAPEGDVITLPTTCSSITLTTGAIEIPQNHLTIEGVRGGTSTISAGNASRVLHHTGNDQLVLKYLTVRDGSYTAPVALGGCIYSASKVSLFADVDVRNCIAHGTLTADANSGLAKGGAVFSASGFHMEDSVVSGGTAHGESAVGALRATGGNIYSGGPIDAKYSEISGGVAVSPIGAAHTVGGGIGTRSNGGVSVRGAQISGNHADFGGGIYAAPSDPSTPVTVTNTAVVHNESFYNGAGLFLASSTPTIVNSTIAQNFGGGISTQVSMTLQSTIVFGNSSSAADASLYDFYAASPIVLAGGYNLIGTINLSISPTFALRDDPMFGTFGFHGGSRQSLPLLRGSPAIDAGIAGATNPPLIYDERGSPASRNLGTAVDIGAYEFDPDPIFADGFERLEN